MYNKLFSIPSLIVGICLIVFLPRPLISYDCPISGFQLAGIILTVLGFFWMFGSIINTMVESKYQLERFKKVIRLQKTLSIDIAFKDKVEKEFRTILTETFPNFEKELVSKFSFDNEQSKEAFLAMCPKLESGNSFELYVDKLSSAIKSIKSDEVNIEEELEEIAVHNENPWLWFKRPMPANIKTLMDKFEGIS
ncbi:hypothetical protein K9M48_03790 [Candidatus Gracilibacteria bacterium]|nr:hypothetical protein [Candidatus Gracilibacteria bacterium]